MIKFVISIMLGILYMSLFFVTWITYSLFRPILLASILCLIAQPKATYRKLELFSTALVYLFRCNDKKWKDPPYDPASFFPKSYGGSLIDNNSNKNNENDNDNNNNKENDNENNNESDSKRIRVKKKLVLFVRHGESTWNVTFNKGDRSLSSFLLGFIPTLLWSMGMEFYWFVSGRCEESWFYDSPLSEKGISQALALRNFMRSISNGTAASTSLESSMVDIMMGMANTTQDFIHNEEDDEEEEEEDESNGMDATVKQGAHGTSSSPSSQLISSNLRRAISTTAHAFYDRLQRNLPNDDILILPQLQEISRNPDALCITPPYADIIRPTWADEKHNLSQILSNRIDTSLHSGNKPLHSSGLERMKQFCSIVFGPKVEHRDVVIVVGHSLWFRSFFRTYLPWDVNHVSKKRKLANGGCVSFLLQKVDRTTTKEDDEAEDDAYMIDPRSVNVIYGGFY